MVLEIQRPSMTARTPTRILRIVYNEKWRKSPDFNKELFSNANVEKVVKPPQNPVDNNNV